MTTKIEEAIKKLVKYSIEDSPDTMESVYIASEVDEIFEMIRKEEGKK